MWESHQDRKKRLAQKLEDKKAMYHNQKITNPTDLYHIWTLALKDKQLALQNDPENGSLRLDIISIQNKIRELREQIDNG